jgi:hypothetical protein
MTKMKPWKKYGMTEAQYGLFVVLRPGCWICERETKKDGKPIRLYTDHDHVNGRVRGRLCYTCNRRLIGRRRHGILYRLAAEYLDSTFDGREIETAKVKARTTSVRLRRRKAS